MCTVGDQSKQEKNTFQWINHKWITWDNIFALTFKTNKWSNTVRYVY